MKNTLPILCAFFLLMAGQKASTQCNAGFTWEQLPGTLTIHFNNTSTSEHDIVSYVWHFGDNHNGDGQNPNHTYSSAGTYTVCLIITDSEGCMSDVCHEITVVPIGGCEAAFGWEQGNGLVIHFIDQSDDDPDIISWYWNFDDGHMSTLQNPVHEFEEPGVYLVCLVVENEFGCVSDVCHEVVVESASGDCEASFGYQVAMDLFVHFTDVSDDDPDIISWHWTFGDGGTSEDADPSHQYNEPGTYLVCLTIENEAGCEDEYCHEIVVEPLGGCEAAFAWETGNDNVVHFIDQSDDDPDIVSWSWSFGDGHMSTLQNPVHEYAGPGIYTVCLLIENEFGCVSDICHQVTVDGGGSACEAAFTWQSGNGNVIHFFDQSDDDPDIVSWMWNFGDGHFGDGQNPVHEYEVPGVYVVCLLVTNEFGCASDICHEVIVEGSGNDCEATFVYDQGPGLVVHFFDHSDDDPDIISWQWNFGDGHMSDAQNPVHEYTGPGIYVVCLIVTNEFGCVSDFCQDVIVEGSGNDCEAAFTWQTGNGNVVHFFDQSDDDPDIVSWMWNFGDGHFGDGQNPVHEYEAPGVYVVCLLVTNEFGCASDICHEVIVQGSGNDCEAAFTWQTGSGNVVHFIDQSDDDPDIVSWMWNFGDGHFGDAQNPVHEYAAPGVYIVCLLVTNEFGCASDICHEVIVEGSGNGCEAAFTWQTGSGNIIHFFDQSDNDPDIISWLWNFGDGHMGDAQNPVHEYEAAGAYMVCLVVTNEFGCVSDICHEVSVQGPEECAALFSFDYSQNGEIVFFENNSTGGSVHTIWHWDFGDGHSSAEENPDHNYEEPGIYTVCLTMTDTATQCFDDICIDLMYEMSFADLHSGANAATFRSYYDFPSSFTDEDDIIIKFANPSGRQLLINFSIARPSDASVQIVDLGGRQVYADELTFSSKGFYQQTFDLGLIPDGVYIMHITRGDKIETRVIFITL